MLKFYDFKISSVSFTLKVNITDNISMTYFEEILHAVASRLISALSNVITEYHFLLRDVK